MPVRHVPDLSKGHKFECETEVTCAKTAKNTASLVVNGGKAFLFLSETTFGSDDVSTRRYGGSFEASVFGYQMRRKPCL